MGQPKEFTVATARPLPVVVLADTSGSMKDDGKIDHLNTALTDMVNAFAEEEVGRAEIYVAIITFGGTAELFHKLSPATQVAMQQLSASGKTPLGAALDLARELMENREDIPLRAYTPALVLVSDGEPTDEWEPALARFLDSPRAQKATRFALGIGGDADASVLKRFLSDPEATVYGASDAGQIKSFFRWVTRSVAIRSLSANPDTSGFDDFPPLDLDELL